jgi:mannose/cellobiose epimerase-like protein (N-acyl-D-glucosamine 2-epimerase family)
MAAIAAASMDRFFFMGRGMTAVKVNAEIIRFDIYAHANIHQENHQDNSENAIHIGIRFFRQDQRPKFCSKEQNYSKNNQQYAPESRGNDTYKKHFALFSADCATTK